MLQRPVKSSTRALNSSVLMCSKAFRAQEQHPHLSYMGLLLSSVSTSYALLISLNLSSAPASLLTSGCHLRASCLYHTICFAHFSASKRLIDQALSLKQLQADPSLLNITPLDSHTERSLPCQFSVCLLDCLFDICKSLLPTCMRF